MSNRSENRNTRKARNFQFTQKSFEQNRKATVLKILDDTLVPHNKDLEFPEIWEIEDLYVSRLEQANTKDISNPKLEETAYSEHYGIIQWNLYKADTIRSKKSARFMEMSAL